MSMAYLSSFKILFCLSLGFCCLKLHGSLVPTPTPIPYHCFWNGRSPRRQYSKKKVRPSGRSSLANMAQGRNGSTCRRACLPPNPCNTHSVVGCERLKENVDSAQRGGFRTQLLSMSVSARARIEPQEPKSIQFSSSYAL